MLTKSDLLAIKKIVDDSFHENISEYHAAMVKPEFDAINTRFDKLEHKVDAHYTWLKDDIKGLTSDMSTSVSKAEFNRLKDRVDKYCPAI
jgi:tetrahydromethanopterin S-methyltransferase subunit G